MKVIAGHDHGLVPVNGLAPTQGIDRSQAERIIFDCLAWHATLRQPPTHRCNFINGQTTSPAPTNDNQRCFFEPKELPSDGQTIDQHRIGLAIRVDPRSRHQDAISYGHVTYRKYVGLGR